MTFQEVFLPQHQWRNLHHFTWQRYTVDLLKFETMTSATSFKEPALQTICLITSSCEVAPYPDLCEVSWGVAGPEDSATRSFSKRASRSANHSWDQRGATRAKEKFVDSITLNKTCFIREKGGNALAMRSFKWWWKASCLHVMWSETEDTYKGSFVFALVANKSKWRKSNTSQMISNTRGRRNHSVRRTWSRWLNWTTQMMSFPECIPRTISPKAVLSRPWTLMPGCTSPWNHVPLTFSVSHHCSGGLLRCGVVAHGNIQLS